MSLPSTNPKQPAPQESSREKLFDKKEIKKSPACMKASLLHTHRALPVSIYSSLFSSSES